MGALAIGHRDARNTEERPRAVENRIAGAGERSGGFAGGARGEQEIDAAHLVGERAAALARTLPQVVVIGAADFPAFVQPRLQRLADLARKIFVLPCERARVL